MIVEDRSGRMTFGRLIAVVAVGALGVAVIAVLLQISGFRIFRFVTLSNPLRTNDVIQQVWDSGLYPAESSSSIFWVDDSTILVDANKGPKPRTIQEMRERLSWLYLWRLGDQPRPHGADPHAAAICAARGEVSYHQNAVDPATGEMTRTRWIGPPGKERRAPPLVRPSGPDAGVAGNLPEFVEPIDCEIFADPKMAGQRYVTDSERRFYLVYGRDRDLPNTIGPLVLMRSDGADRKTLQLHGSATYRMFDSVFWVSDVFLSDNPDLGNAPYINDFRIWRESQCWPAWRVEPETGKTERICIPYGPWVGETHLPEQSDGTIELAPTKAGLFFSYSRRKGASGLYKLEGTLVRHVVEGNIKGPVMSPNGCRIAFTHIPNDDAYSLSSSVTTTIAAIDLCNTTTEPH